MKRRLLAIFALFVVLSSLFVGGVSAEPTECNQLSEYESEEEYRDCLVDNTSKDDVLRIVQQDKSELSQKQIDAVHAVYPYNSDEYNFTSEEEQQIVEWMSGVEFNIGDSSENSTNTTTETPESDSGSEWSKARILALIDDHVDQHPSIDVDSLEVYYQENQDEFSAVEQRYVEAWIEWYRTGEKPLEGLHPDLSTIGGVAGGEPRDTNRLNNSVSASSLEQGQREVTDTVTVLGYEFNQKNETVVMVIESRGEQTVIFTDSGGTYETNRLQSQRLVLQDGKNYVKVPAVTYEGNQQVTLKQGLEGAVLINAPPPLLQSEDNIYIWYGATGGVLGVALMSLMWYIRRERIFQEFRPASRLIADQVKTDKGFINRFTPGDGEQEDEYDDDIRGLIRRYASIKSLLSSGAKVVILAYLLDAANVITMPAINVGDEAKIILGMGVVGYSILGPVFVKPILKAAYSISLEKIQLLDVDGSVNGSYWAKKGTFRTDYENETSRDVPVRETSTGERCYLVRQVDRDDRTFEPAFSWQAEEVDEIEGLESETAKFTESVTVGIDQILSSAGMAAYVIKDMADAAYTGHKLRQNWGLIRATDAYEMADEQGEGLEKAFTGGSVRDVMADVIDSYERRDEESESTVEEIDEVVDDSSQENGGDTDE
jgi:hypothetical protein